MRRRWSYPYFYFLLEDNFRINCLLVGTDLELRRKQWGGFMHARDAYLVHPESITTTCLGGRHSFSYPPFFLFRCLERLVRSLVNLPTHSFLPFTDCPEFCVENYAPLCGNDRKTYENNCYFKQAQCKNEKLAIAHRGECKGNIEGNSKM